MWLLCKICSCCMYHHSSQGFTRNWFFNLDLYRSKKSMETLQKLIFISGTFRPILFGVGAIIFCLELNAFLLHILLSDYLKSRLLLGLSLKWLFRCRSWCEVLPHHDQNTVLTSIIYSIISLINYIITVALNNQFQVVCICTKRGQLFTWARAMHLCLS